MVSKVLTYHFLFGFVGQEGEGIHIPLPLHGVTSGKVTDRIHIIWVINTRALRTPKMFFCDYDLGWKNKRASPTEKKLKTFTVGREQLLS